MNRIVQAFNVFFRILGDAGYAQRVGQLDQSSTPSVAAPSSSAPAPSRPRRSEAMALLATLQREGRLVDFLQEPVEGYTDAQIGAAARDIHRGCKSAVDRIFKLAPVLSQPEGATVRVESGYDAGRIRLTGNVSGNPPYSGTLFHPGWQASQCELPEWTGSDAAAKVIAPAEVEIK